MIINNDSAYFYCYALFWHIMYTAAIYCPITFANKYKGALNLKKKKKNS